MSERENISLLCRVVGKCFQYPAYIAAKRLTGYPITGDRRRSL